jgi:hypothetical protein
LGRQSKAKAASGYLLLLASAATHEHPRAVPIYF